MHELSACAEELADHLDAMSMLACCETRRQVDECWCIAMRLSGLMRVVSDGVCEPRAMELEVEAESLIGSLQHWAERVQGIEGVLEGVRGRVEMWRGGCPVMHDLTAVLQALNSQSPRKHPVVPPVP